MRRLIFILLFFPVLLQAQTTWYVSASGNDVSGAGTLANPWRTIYKATSTVPAIDGAAGDVIHVGAGTFYIANNCDLADVTLEGEGYTTNVIWTLATDTWGIDVTNSGGTIHIRNIRFNGNSTTGRLGINVYNANNVWIHDCFFENFLRSAVAFDGSTFRTGNRFYNNTVTNCSGGLVAPYSDESIAVRLDRQTDFLFQNNTVNETIRPVTTSGIAVGGYVGNKGLQILNSTISARYRSGTHWPFGIELWYNEGLTIAYCTIPSEIDLGGYGVYKGAYVKGLDFHHNIVGPATAPGQSAVGLQIEQYCSDVYIYQNIFRNLEQPIYHCGTWTIDKVDYINGMHIYSNLFYNVNAYTNSGWAIRFETGENSDTYFPPSYIRDIDIYNNTIVASATNPARYGILLPCQATTSGVRNIDVRNNIISGFSSYPIYSYLQDNDYTQSIDTLNITYNDYYGNGHNFAYFSVFAPTHYTSATGILTTNPSFVSSSDFHLQSGSGAIRTGAYISTVTMDLDGLNFLNPPSMGAYEYTSSASIPTITTTSITAITATTATGGGTISSDGGSAVTARGVCWSTSINPVASGSHTSNGTGTRSFTSSITGLSDGTTYYVRAYATNSIGTAYGANQSFTASATPVSTGVRLLKRLNGRLLIRGNNFLKRQ